MRICLRLKVTLIRGISAVDKVHFYDLSNFTADASYDGVVTTIGGKDVLTVTDPCVPVEPGDGAGNAEDVYVDGSPLDVKQRDWDGTWFGIEINDMYSFEQFGSGTAIYKNDYIVAWEMQLPANPTGGLIRFDNFIKATDRNVGASYLWPRAYWYGDAGGKGTGQIRDGTTNVIVDSEWWEGTAGGNTFASQLGVKVRSKINGNYRHEVFWSHPEEEALGTIGYIFDDSYMGLYQVVLRVQGGADDEIKIRGLTSEGHEEKFCTLYLARAAIWTSPAWVIPQDATSVDTLILNTNAEISSLLSNPIQVSTNGGSVWQDLGENKDLTALGDPPVAGDDMRVKIYFDSRHPNMCMDAIKEKPVIYEVGAKYQSKGYKPSADIRRVV